jgi:hypothetical protein
MFPYLVCVIKFEIGSIGQSSSLKKMVIYSYTEVFKYANNECNFHGTCLQVATCTPQKFVEPARCDTRNCVEFHALFAWLISHQPTILFSQNKPATTNQPAVFFSQNKPAPAISHQPNEQAVR